MQHMISEIGKNFYALGYKKRKNSFWKEDNGFYKLINFQNGSYGNYFFVNVCFHPIGLPLLRTNGLPIPAHPNPTECIVAQRAENIVGKDSYDIFKTRLGTCSDEEIVQGIVNSIPCIETWLNSWCACERILNCDFEELSKCITTVPMLKPKAFLLLKCFCAVHSNNIELSKRFFLEYINTIINEFNFDEMDTFLERLVYNE